MHRTAFRESYGKQEDISARRGVALSIFIPCVLLAIVNYNVCQYSLEFLHQLLGSGNVSNSFLTVDQAPDGFRSTATVDIEFLQTNLNQKTGYENEPEEVSLVIQIDRTERKPTRFSQTREEG